MILFETVSVRSQEQPVWRRANHSAITRSGDITSRGFESRVMNLQMHSELDSLIEPAGAGLASAVCLSSTRSVIVKSLANIIVINVISIILLIGNSG
ncbi:MAG: hypothetical protein V7641_5675 [Blastocatellia bacterium]